MTVTTEHPGDEGVFPHGPDVPIGWTVKIGLERRIGGFVLVGRCSCGYVSARGGGEGAWERVSKHIGQHVNDKHLRRFMEWV